MTTFITPLAIIIAIYFVGTFGVVMTYEIVAEIKGALYTPLWLEDAKEFVADKLWFWAW